MYGVEQGTAMSKMTHWLNKPNQRSEIDTHALKDKVIAALRTVYDPEIPVNIYDLGLIYGLDINVDGKVNIEMTLTAPGCPVAQSFPATVEGSVMQVEDVSEAHVELVWDPPWTQDRMTDEVKLQLGLL
jgi:FeS assembly SUF system protein